MECSRAVDLLIGGLLSIGALVAGWLLNDLTRARKTRADGERWRAEFHRDTLLSLQEALADMTQAVMRVSEARLAGEDETAREWEARRRDAFQLSIVLVARVDDEDLRDKFRSFRFAAAKAVTDDTGDTRALEDLSNAFRRLNDDLGERLRPLL
jgi:hypothetical protein